MRAVPGISYYLPSLAPHLADLVLLEDKAVELYHRAILDAPIPGLPPSPAVFAVPRAGKAAAPLQSALLASGYRRLKYRDPETGEEAPAYFREDLGWLLFRAPQAPVRPEPGGLAAVPDGEAAELLEEPHTVEVEARGTVFEVRVPSLGAFVRALSRRLAFVHPRHRNPAGALARSARAWTLLWDLLVLSPDLAREALGDLEESRPPSRAREFRERLDAAGPGTPAWEAGWRRFTEIHPAVKQVTLESWFWDFRRQLLRLVSTRPVAGGKT